MRKGEGLIPGIDPGRVEGKAIKPAKRGREGSGTISSRAYNILTRRGFKAPGERFIDAGVLAEPTEEELLNVLNYDDEGKPRKAYFGPKSLSQVKNAIRYLAKDDND